MRKSRAYYQYMLDLADNKVSYYSSDDVSQIVYDLLDEGEVDEAMAACRKGQKQHPDEAVLQLIEAKVLLHQRDYANAQRVLECNPERETPFGYSIQFGINIGHGHAASALEQLQQQLRAYRILPLEYVEIIDENFDHLPYDLTAQHLLQTYQMLKEERPSDDQSAEVYGRIGGMLMDCHAHADAITVLETAIDHDAYDIYSWQDLTRCQFELQRFDDCLYSSEMGLAIDPLNPLFNFVLGVIKAQDGHAREAIDHLELARQYVEGKLKHEAIEQERSEVERQTCITYEILGRCYMQTDDPDKAIACFTTLVGHAPHMAESHFLLATALTDKGQKDEAFTQIEEALRIEPTNEVYLSFKLTLLTDKHSFEDAISVLDLLIELQPDSRRYLLAKAELSLNLRRYEDADQAYRKLLRMKPKDPTSITLMKAYFESIGDVEALRKINNRRR